MYRILVLGGEGMLGYMVKRVLSRAENLTVNSTCYERKPGYFSFKIENGIEELREILDHHESFDYVINCIGILNSSINQNDPKSVYRAILINSLFPHELARVAKERSVRVVQISTDGVFAKNTRSCLEDSTRNCDDVYGWTKALGEVKSPNVLNLRSSIIGPSPNLQKGLLEWFLSQPKRSIVSGYTDQIWSGVTTLQFADLCKNLIIDCYFDLVCKEAPTHHFCPNQTISKYELLQLFRSLFRPDIIVKPITNHKNAVSRTLDTKYTSIKKLFGYNNSWQQAISELALEMKNDK